MTAATFPQQGASIWLKLWWYVIALPWHAIKVYPPVLLIASSAAYASSMFAAHQGVFPEPFNVMQAIAFEWVYLGALALAGQRRGPWFYTTVAFGACTSALYMFLHAAERYGMLSTDPNWIMFYVACHAIPLTLVGVSYMLLIHVHVQDREDKEAAEAQRIADMVMCRYCGTPCKNQLAEYSHFRTCPKHPKNLPQA